MVAPRKPRTFAPNERGLEQSFGRAAVILNAITAAGDSGLRFVDIVRKTGFSQTTVHRLLSALAENGFVEQDSGSSSYFVGMRLAGWAFAVANRFGLASAARDAMQTLCDATGDTIYLTVRSGNTAVCISRLIGSHPIKALVVKPGDRRVLGMNAGGIALLAFIPELAEIERLVTLPEQQEGRAAWGVTDEMVREWIASARALGYAHVSDIVLGSGAIAMPLHNASREPIGALSLAAVSDRLREPRLTEVMEKIRTAVRDIELKLQDMPSVSGL